MNEPEDDLFRGPITALERYTRLVRSGWMTILKPLEKDLFLCYQAHADQAGTTFLGIDQVAVYLGCDVKSPSHLRRARAALIEHELLVPLARKRLPSGALVSYFRVQVPDPPAAAQKALAAGLAALQKKRDAFGRDDDTKRTSNRSEVDLSPTPANDRIPIVRNTQANDREPIVSPPKRSECARANDRNAPTEESKGTGREDYVAAPRCATVEEVPVEDLDQTSTPADQSRAVAAVLGVTPGDVNAAARLLKSGRADLVHAVEQGRMELDAALAIAAKNEHEVMPEELTKAGKPQPAAAPCRGDDIAAIYRAYPRKKEPKPASKAIAKALAEVTLRPAHEIDYKTPAAWLLTRTLDYAAARQRCIDAGTSEQRYTPHPATWFNAGSYDEDPAEWEPVLTKGTSGKATSSKSGRYSRIPETYKGTGLNERNVER